MATSFNTMQLRVNRAAVRKLATASANWWPGGFAGGPAVDGLQVVFDSAAIEALAGIVQGLQPVAIAYAPDMPTAKRGDGLVVDGISYVMQKAKADNAGLLVMDLLKGTAL
jgi:hypothetical protein